MLRLVGKILIFIGVVIAILTPVYISYQENTLRSNIVSNLESEISGIPEALRNVPEPSNTIAADSQEYSINGTILIESEGFEAVLMNDVSEESLNLGIGHYPGTAFPGQVGNFAVAVHRPLVGNIDTMGAGDEIIVTNNGIKYTYEWRESFVVAPDRVDVLDSMQGKWLTLTTCHPRYSNAQRLIVRAELTQVGG